MKHVYLLVEGLYDAKYLQALTSRYRPELLSSIEFTALKGINNLDAEEPNVFTVALKSDHPVVALICDADESLATRWKRVRSACSIRGLQLPESLPPDGLLMSGKGVRRFGCWIMPNNEAMGAMETWMLRSITDRDQVSLIEQARKFVQNATPRKFPETGAAEDKACLRAWMAVQSEPHWTPSASIEFGKLFPTEDAAKPFLDWVKKLTEL